ncbi:MAG: uroporphyrinogen decarboxylase family protein [bacterium]
MDKISQVVDHKITSAVFPLVCADHCAHLLNIPFSEVATNGSKLAEVLAYGYDQYQYDMILVFSDPYVEAQALGCPVELDPYPTLRGPKSNKHLDRTHEVMKAAEILKRDLDVPVFVSIKGVFSLAAFLGGVEHFLRILLKRESEANEFLEQAMQFLETYLDSILSLGVNVFIGDPLASSSVISPAIFRKYALDPLITMVQRVKAQGALAGIHICGDTQPILEILDHTGADILSIENVTTKTETLRMGGVSTQTILNGDAGSISLEVLSALSITPLILSTSCDVPPQTDPASIMTMLRVAREYQEL